MAKRYYSSITGRFVSKEYAAKNKTTTFALTINPKKRRKKKKC
jgi:hypothetical protein